ncbi:MAG: MBL fold metallo-hydrolase [Thermomicrobium sp.]|nr:MBL fold metallo-hydrolase [Thermomicrobium sp.]MDW8059073.1 MBL fold metallo-hydrolase [Thermomicrobium sp.]
MTRSVPITEEAPQLFRIALPLWPRHPLGHVNVYLVLSDAGPILIDCGPDTPEAYETLLQALRTLGVAPADLRTLFLTHAHPDHCGLLVRLREAAPLRCYAHPEEASGAHRESSPNGALDEWFARAGVPETERTAFREISRTFQRRACAVTLDRPVTGEETLVWPPYTFRVLWVPGHAPGLLCLYEPARHLLIASDHILPDTSPHVGSLPHRHDKPLSSYLASLERIRQLPVERTLPGHGQPFGEARPRIEELLVHHRERLQEVLTVLADGPKTAYEVATRLAWMGRRDSWPRLDPFQRFLALTETIAHLEHLVDIGELVASDGRYALLPL